MDGSAVRARLGWLAVGVVLCAGGVIMAAPAASAAIAPAVRTQQAPTTTLAPSAVAPATTTADDTSAGEVRVGDPEADRTIRRIVLALVGLAGFLLLVTIVFWRVTRPVPIPLRRLATMGSRSWRRGSELKRDELLGPAPVRAGAARGVEVVPAAAVAPVVVAAPELEPGAVVAASDDGRPQAEDGAPVEVAEEVSVDVPDEVPIEVVDGAPVEAVDDAASAGEPSETSASLLADG
jgi:hypothetical protein